MNPGKRKEESCDNTEMRKRHRIASQDKASFLLEGSYFYSECNVSGSANFHQGNIVNYHASADRSLADRCVADLRVTDPRQDKERIQETKGGLLSDCYTWVFDNPEFCQWRGNENQRLLWVKGDPGKGKTMLLCGIIDQIEETTRAQGSHIAYFFCQATDARINTAVAVLRGLIYMLLSQDRPLVSHMEEDYNAAGEGLFQGPNAWYALRSIFLRMLHDPKLRGAYLVIDALDECKEGLDQLLGLITEASELIGAKWLISSRNGSRLQQQLRSVELKLSLELSAESVSAAVNSYIEQKMKDLAQEKEYLESTKQEVSFYLRNHADGTFLWVALVCQELKAVSERETRERVQKFPPGLDALYQQIMEQVCASACYEECFQFLALATTTYRPLSLLEYVSIFEDRHDRRDSTPDDTEWEMSEPAPDRSVRQLVDSCGSFLTVREGTVYFVHQSAKDFLVKKQPDIFLQYQATAHGQIVLKSVEAMSPILDRNIYGLPYPDCPVDVARPAPDPLERIGYSCIYWVSHLMEATKSPDRDDLQFNGPAYSFLRRKGLYWIESLSLLRSMSEGMIALKNLIQHLRDRPKESRLQALVIDAYRLLQTFRPAIESRPLQLYVSALVFSPKQSLLRRLFHHEAPQWVHCKTEVAEEWGACKATLEGHRDDSKSVAFSPDGRRVVSASSDETIKIWDSVTGTCEATLEGHEGEVSSAAFSPDGQYIVSAATDNTVKLWHAQKHVCTKTLEGHEGKVSSVAFSPDGRYIVSASEDWTIKIWDVRKGTCKATLEGHEGGVNSATFSPDMYGRYIVSASSDETINIWDSVTETCEATLEGHEGEVSSAAFSPDGQYIVSASHDGTIKVWDVQNGACKATRKSDVDPALSAAFSPDGVYVISGWANGTIGLWDWTAATDKYEAMPASNWVSSVAFSPDGQHIVSALGSGTVKLWDTLQFKQTGGGADVTSVAFSPDRRRVVSETGFADFRLWNSQTGAREVTLKRPASEAWIATFAPDKGRTVAASGDHTVEPWDVLWHLKKHEGREDHNYWVRSAALSFDRRRVVLASENEAFKLWDEVVSNCEAVYDIGYTSSWSCDPTGTLLYNDSCTIRLDGAMPPNLDAKAYLAILADRQAYGISPDRSWIQYQSRPVLWIPPEYRPNCTAVAEVDGYTAFVLGCNSDGVYLFHLDAVAREK